MIYAIIKPEYTKKEYRMHAKKETMVMVIILLTAFFWASGCDAKAGSRTNQAAEGIEENALQDTAAAQAGELIQGTWQHTEDKSNFLVFEGRTRKETGAGMEGWDVEEFILSDRCMNESDAERDTPAEEGRYISCPKSDMCWYIIHVDAATLSLSYVSTGRTLTYARWTKEHIPVKVH
jgi:hypothetical protein